MRSLRPIDLDISKLAFEPAAWTVRGAGDVERTAALLRVRGSYRPGSAGSEDARLIRWKIAALCDLVRPAALVVDVRELDYRWGDDLTLHPPQPSTLLRVVMREEQRAALVPVLGSEPLRADLDATLDEVDEALRATPPRRPSARGPYRWTEIWADRDAGEEVVLLRAAGDGRLELSDPGRRQLPYQSFASEEEAVTWLRDKGYERVGARREG
jgi:hypothetical protein